MSKPIIIIGFAGVGKTTLAKKYSNVLDFEYLHYRYTYSQEMLETKTFEQLKGAEEGRKMNPRMATQLFRKIKRKSWEI